MVPLLPTGYGKALDALERVREPAIALLLINAVLYVDSALVLTADMTLPSIPTPWGEASSLLGAILLLASFAVFYWVVGPVQINLLISLAPWLGKRADMSGLSLEQKVDMVDIWELDTYLDVQEDSALERAYNKQKRVVNNIKLVRENSGVALVLLIVQIWFLPDSIVQSLLASLPWPTLMIIVSIGWLFCKALVPASDGYYKVYLPGKGAQVSRISPTYQLKRARPWLEDEDEE